MQVLRNICKNVTAPHKSSSCRSCRITSAPLRILSEKMDQNETARIIREEATNTIESLHKEGLSRKEIIEVLVADQGVPTSSAYRFFSAFIAQQEQPWDSSPLNSTRTKAIQALERLLEDAENRDDKAEIKEISSIILKSIKR